MDDPYKEQYNFNIPVRLQDNTTDLICFDLIWFIVLNSTFSNISAISLRQIFAVEEAGVLEKITDHGQATGNLYHLRSWIECTLFCILQSRARTHAVLVIGLYELLANPIT